MAAKARCLILACGNTLRSDDGVGPRLAAWAEKRFRDDNSVRVISRPQFTAELAEDIAAADSVLFVDASLKSPAGRVHLVPVTSRVVSATQSSHDLTPNQLLGLTRSLYGSIKSHAMLLTVGAGFTELGETLSSPVESALPRAQGVLEKAVRRFIAS